MFQYHGAIISEFFTQNKRVQAQHDNLGTVSPLLEWLKYYNSKIHKVNKHKITMWY
jgi:hypothetical protein